MNFLEFKDKMFELACFTTRQVYAWEPGFDRNNFVRWSRKGMIIRLRQGYYTFPEYKAKPDYVMFFANRIYQPSYISLHSALAFYGIIPEAVIHITSISSLKTNAFTNALGEYIYKSVRKDLMFGYELKPMADGRSIRMACLEKALLDLLYLYPFINTVSDMLDLRLDEELLQEDLNAIRLKEYTSRFDNRELQSRVQLLMNTYGL